MDQEAWTGESRRSGMGQLHEVAVEPPHAVASERRTMRDDRPGTGSEQCTPQPELAGERCRRMPVHAVVQPDELADARPSTSSW